MTPTRKMPLILVSGASGIGKSTACELLFAEEEDYIVLESDLLWEDRWNTPEDKYRGFRRLWLRVCANVAQIGKPVVLCGSCVPDQFEDLPETEYFTALRFIAIVGDDDTLIDHMRNGRGITDEGWIQSSLDFNRWLRTHGETNEPKITLIDNTDKTPEQVAEELDLCIRAAIADL